MSFANLSYISNDSMFRFLRLNAHRDRMRKEDDRELKH